MIRRRVWLPAALGLLCAGCNQAAQDTREPGEASSPAPVTIYLIDEAGFALDCAAVRPVAWSPEPGGGEPMDQAVRRVMRDMTPSATLHPEGTLPLLEYFRGIRIVGRTAVLRFEGTALVYLNSAACMQMATKAPIVATVLDFEGIDEVAWEIDGVIFDAWDA